MGLTNFPNGVTSFGMPVVGGGNHITTGNVFFVDSGHTNASDGNTAKSPSDPAATIDGAVGKCTANNGDMIFVMPGHTETVTAAAGLDLDVAGISLIGIGRGSDRPTINFTTVSTADMDVDAANVYMENFLITGGFDGLAGMVDVNAADFTMVNCETRDVTGQMEVAIEVGADADRCTITGWKHRGATAAGTVAALRIGSADDCTVSDFWVDGDFASAAIANISVASSLTIGGGIGESYIRNRNSGDVAIACQASATGQFGPKINIQLADDAANVSTCVVGASFVAFNPIRVVNAVNESDLELTGTIWTASTDA